MKQSTTVLFIVLFLLVAVKFEISECVKSKEKPSWAKKDIRDFNDADMERLFDQWEEDEDPLPEDELPEHLRTPPSIDMSKLDTSDPEKLMEASKKGRTLMVFVTVAGNPTRHRADELTKLWQSALWNNHIQAERFMVDDDRAIFMFKDGSQAWPAKSYLVEQEELKEVTIEGKVYPGTKADVRNQAVRFSDEL